MHPVRTMEAVPKILSKSITWHRSWSNCILPFAYYVLPTPMILQVGRRASCESHGCCHELPRGMSRVSQNRVYTPFTIYDRIFGDFPAENTVHTPYIWFWPTWGMGLTVWMAGDLQLQTKSVVWCGAVLYQDGSCDLKLQTKGVVWCGSVLYQDGSCLALGCTGRCAHQTKESL